MIIRRLIWDEWNIDHIARHNVEPEEAEEVCRSKNLFERGKDGAYQITGQTETGRYLTIILVPRTNSFYLVTARDASDSERRRYTKKV